MARFGVAAIYAVDALTFVTTSLCLSRMRHDPREGRGNAATSLHMLEGLRYAWRHPVLLGTYFVDIVAMLFAFPVALFPVMAQGWGGADAAGKLLMVLACGLSIRGFWHYRSGGISQGLKADLGQ